MKPITHCPLCESPLTRDPVMTDEYYYCPNIKCCLHNGHYVEWWRLLARQIKALKPKGEECEHYDYCCRHVWHGCGNGENSIFACPCAAWTKKGTKK